MTEGYQPPTSSGSAVRPDQETTALPHLQQTDRSAWQAGPAPSVWDPVADVGNSQPDSTNAPLGGIGAKLTAAGAAAVAAASSAATTAKDAIKSAANEAETRSADAPGPAARPGARPGAGRAASRAARSTSRQPRKARLTLSHINVYSIFKFSCVLAIALFFVWLIMVGVLYGILDVSGALGQVNKAVRTISGNDNAKDVVTGSLVFGSAIIIGAVNIILFIAMSTIGAMVYNLCADLVGGAEVTLSERE
jgi:hypothetical protein